MTTSYTDRERQVMLAAGGRPRVMAHGAEVWDFGWVHPDNYTPAMEACARRVENTILQPFSINGPANHADKADLTKFWSNDKVVSALGFPYTGTHQLTGSCVGAGGGNAASSLCFREIIVSGEAERPVLVFYPFTYGRSRYQCGMHGRGEGSTGAGWMEAATKDGVLSNEHDQLPKPKNTSDGIIWGESVEMEWSAGDQAPCKDWVSQGTGHLIKTASQMRSSSQVWDALVNGYPVTCASMYAFKANVEDGVLLGRKQGSWDHPKHGKIFWLHNQWGLDAHGRCPTGMPGGGAWITAKDVDWICGSGGEVYAFSFYNGYPSLDMDWDCI
jgi:hypothetical protein